MFTITSYFGFLLAVLIITLALFIGLSKIRLIWFVIWKFIVNLRIRYSIVPYYVNLQFSVIEIHDQYRLIFKDRYYLSFYLSNKKNDWSFSIWNRVRFNSYYFGWIICNCIFTISTRWSVGSLINVYFVYGFPIYLF